MLVLTTVVVVVIAGGVLYFQPWTTDGKKRLKGIRSNIAALGGLVVSALLSIAPQLETFPWRQYLGDNAALAATLGTLGLVGLFTVLKKTNH